MDRELFEKLGYAVMRNVFDPTPLVTEVDSALRDGAPRCATRQQTGRSFRFVPMMCERTPVSLALLDRFTTLAEDLLGDRVMPTRAKGVEYSAPTPWHVDSSIPVRSIGVLAYLDPLRTGTGALEIVPRSHRQAAPGGLDGHIRSETSITLTTDPGDLIVIDERLVHRNEGAQRRRQWRVDYLPEPKDSVVAELVRRYFDEVFADDGGYSTARYPSYGDHWRRSGRACVELLEDFGAYTAAAGAGCAG